MLRDHLIQTLCVSVRMRKRKGHVQGRLPGRVGNTDPEHRFLLRSWAQDTASSVILSEAESGSACIEGAAAATWHIWKTCPGRSSVSMSAGLVRVIYMGGLRAGKLGVITARQIQLNARHSSWLSLSSPRKFEWVSETNFSSEKNYSQAFSASMAYCVFQSIISFVPCKLWETSISIWQKEKLRFKEKWFLFFKLKC